MELSEEHAQGGPGRLFVEQLTDGVARPRPRTPAYPAITEAFSRAFLKIMIDGAPVQATLDEAGEAIDKDPAAHDGYPQDGS